MTGSRLLDERAVPPLRSVIGSLLAASETADFAVARIRLASLHRCLLGAHYFGSPHLTVGPSFTCVTEEGRTVRLLGARFDGLWERSHDVLPAIVGVLERVRVESASSG